jgi:hypothetical protein
MSWQDYVALGTVAVAFLSGNVIGRVYGRRLGKKEGYADAVTRFDTAFAQFAGVKTR